MSRQIIHFNGKRTKFSKTKLGTRVTLSMSGLIEDGGILIFASLFNLMRYHISGSLWKTPFMRKGEGKGKQHIKVLTCRPQDRVLGEPTCSKGHCSKLRNRGPDRQGQDQSFHIAPYTWIFHHCPHLSTQKKLLQNLNQFPLLDNDQIAYSVTIFLLNNKNNNKHFPLLRHLTILGTVLEPVYIHVCV